MPINSLLQKTKNKKRKTKNLRKALQVPLSKHNKNQCDFILIRDMAKIDILLCFYCQKQYLFTLHLRQSNYTIKS